MASPLDIGLLEHFKLIFPFLLIFAITFGVLSYTKIFGDNKAIYAIIALVFGIVPLFSPIARDSINMMAPWFVLLFFFLVILVVSIMIFGVTEGEIKNYMIGPTSKLYWIVAFALIIGFGSIAHVVTTRGAIGVTPDNSSQIITSAEQGQDQQSQFWATIVNPKVLGLILVLLIAFLAIQYLTKMTN